MGLERGFKILHLDECYVNKHTIAKAAWTQPKTNFEIDLRDWSSQVYCVCAAVSREYGLAHFEIYPHSISKIKYKMFIDGIRRKYPFDDIMLVAD